MGEHTKDFESEIPLLLKIERGRETEMENNKLIGQRILLA